MMMIDRKSCKTKDDKEVEEEEKKTMMKTAEDNEEQAEHSFRAGPGLDEDGHERRKFCDTTCSATIWHGMICYKD